ncbi:hypothetical protein [Methyloceanibacter sp.]|uniref:hypothetical protein n=1 Tax=Methyloceanibacter sp. TaxID=1965321 RepID=UPI003D6DA5AC
MQVDAADAPAFARLTSNQPAVLECEFDYRSPRTKETFAGRFRLTRGGEAFLVVQRNGEPPNECRLSLRGFSFQERTHTGNTEISAARWRACEPPLSEASRKRLNDSVKLSAPRGAREGEMAIIYLEGFLPCASKVWDEDGMNALKQDLTSGVIEREKIGNEAEPLDLHEERLRLEKEGF